ncbi:MAG: site-specific integrase [Gammaproteobacteria bacterium]|nr:site-specific integrase [Gammaproteobacteria bacterium]
MSKVFITKKAAQKWAKETEVAIESGDLHNLTNKTVSDAIGRYKEEEKPKAYHVTVLNFWDKELGRRKLSQIRRAHVIEARKALLTNLVQKGPNKGKPLAPSTVNRRVALLSKVFRIAIEEWDWARDNPCHVRALPEHNERDRLLSGAEQQALYEALKKHSEPSLYPFVMVALYTGMRASEVQRLKWQDLDIETGHIQIKVSKNNEKRSVVVGGEALELLKTWRKEKALKWQGYVFGNSYTGKAPYNYRAHWKEAKEAAGIEDFRFHDLRHAFTTAALTAGMNPVMVQLVTGHKSSQMLKRYSHLTKDVAAQVSASFVASTELAGQTNGE